MDNVTIPVWVASIILTGVISMVGWAYRSLDNKITNADLKRQQDVAELREDIEGKASCTDIDRLDKKLDLILQHLLK